VNSSRSLFFAFLIEIPVAGVLVSRGAVCEIMGLCIGRDEEAIDDFIRGFGVAGIILVSVSYYCCY